MKYLELLKALLLKSLFLAAGEKGMATFNDENLAQSEDEYPEQKINPGEVNTRTKTISIRKLLDRIYSSGDEILGVNLPENAKILDAQLRIDGSTGAGGIFDMGLKAGLIYDEESTESDKLEDFSEDAKALIDGADAGGAAVFARMDANSNLLGSKNHLKRVGLGGLQLFVACTEATTTTDSSPVTLEGFVTYMLEH